MSTRRSLILKWADDQSIHAIDIVPEYHTTRKNTMRSIHVVCRALVDRKKPRYPSAAEVAESGNTSTFGFSSFPSKQTIYNQYGEMLGYWRKAFRDIENLEAQPAASSEQLLVWDASHLDVGAQENVRALQRLVREMMQRNNALRTLITNHIPVDLDHFRPEDAGLIDDLSHWMSTVSLDGFILSEFGLVVTPRSGPGTIIMDQSLWEGLDRMVKIHELAQKSKRSREDYDSGIEPS
jgi:hypothetical protein